MTDSEENIMKRALDRRSVLKALGATAATATATGVASDTSDAASYDTIKVPSNTKKIIEVGAGKTFENKLIDITADGAHVKILTKGDGWVVRNIGIKGENNNRNGTYGTLYLRAQNGGTGIAENIYMGDGAADRVGHAAVSDWDNAGEVTIRNIHVQGWSADGMYMSHAGANPQSQGGITHVENAYLKNNNIENCRLGGMGSTIKDSVIHVETQSDSVISSNESDQINARGLWFKEKPDNTAINCDIKVNGSHAVFASDSGSGVLKDCRVDGPITGDIKTENVSGNPDTTPPDTVPMTAEEAASGSSGGSGGSGESTSTDGPSHTLTLMAGKDTHTISYSVTVDGGISMRTNAGDKSAESSNDSITTNSDGTMTAEGVCGNGYGDSYTFTGNVTSIDLDESKWTIYLDGKQVTVDELLSSSGTLSNTLVIDGSNASDPTDYTFSVSGTVQANSNLGAGESSDTVDGSKVTGTVGSSDKDGYKYSGELTGLTLDGPATVNVDES